MPIMVLRCEGTRRIFIFGVDVTCKVQHFCLSHCQRTARSMKWKKLRRHLTRKNDVDSAVFVKADSLTVSKPNQTSFCRSVSLHVVHTLALHSCIHDDELGAMHCMQQSHLGIRLRLYGSCWADMDDRGIAFGHWWQNCFWKEKGSCKHSVSYQVEVLHCKRCLFVTSIWAPNYIVCVQKSIRQTYALHIREPYSSGSSMTEFNHAARYLYYIRLKWAMLAFDEFKTWW